MRSIHISAVEVCLCILFAWGAWRNKWLADDGYIYLTYVRNFTENDWGPVLNFGEHVEGFTSPAWFAILALLNLFRPSGLMDLRQAVLLLSLALSIAAVAAWIRVETVTAGRKVSNTEALPPNQPMGFKFDNLRLNLPLAFVAVWYPMQSFATSGLETPLEFAAIMVVIYYVWSGSGSTWAVGLIAGLLPLVRPEFGLISIMLLGRHWFGNRNARSILLSGSLFVTPLIILLFIRITVYGQIFPNTYYAKTNTEFGSEAGRIYLRDTVLTYGLHWVIAAAALAVIIPALGRGKRRLDPAHYRRAWLLATSVLLTLYVIAIGGDFMHVRFLLPSVMLMIAVFAGLGTRGLAFFDRGAQWGLHTAIAVSLSIVLSMQYTTPIQRLLTKDGAKGASDFLNINDESFSYYKMNSELHAWNPQTVHSWAVAGLAARGLSEILDTEIGLTSRAIGQISYYGQMDRGNVYVYDVLGLTQPVVARLDMSSAKDVWLRVGHAKVAPDVLVAADPRVDFHSPYFDDWERFATVTFEGRNMVLVNLDMIDSLVQHGIFGANKARELRAWILKKLAGPSIDRNFVTFLTMKYHREDAVLARIRELSPYDRASSWRKWLNDTALEREILSSDGCEDVGAIACFGRAVARQEAPPILTLANAPDLVDLPS